MSNHISHYAMMQNFEPIELDRNFDYPAFNQYGNHQEEINKTPGPSETACNTPNPPPGCENQAMSVNIDVYTPILIIIAVAVGLIKLKQTFSLKNKHYEN